MYSTSNFIKTYKPITIIDDGSTGPTVSNLMTFDILYLETEQTFSNLKSLKVFKLYQ